MPLVVLGLLPCESADAVVLCRNGTALMHVVVLPEQSSDLNRSAQDLADYLGRMGNAKFQIIESDSQAGITLRIERAPDRPEHYVIQPHESGLHIVGGSALAVQHAVWDLLYRLGHRQYFPSSRWEIIPRHNEIKVLWKADEQPDYRSRRIWYGYSTNSWNVESYRQWIKRNRMGGAFELNTGHAWNDIVRRNKSKFSNHPEWLALINGQRITPNGIEKFCVSNAVLRQFVVADVLKRAQATPRLDSISLDPSDGLGWCECAPCAEIGTPSDRVILLANDAAKALERAGHQRMHIGVYAYAGHARGPNIKPHPKVIVSVATAFSDRTPDELLSEWQRAGVNQLGIRGYHSVFAWDHNLPGLSRASNTQYLAETIPRFHGYGARFYTSESGDIWGSGGFGHFLSARLLWDVDEANRVEQLFRRFIQDCFGAASEPMAKFFRLIDGANKPLISKDLIGRMYRCIEAAQRMTNDARVIARLEHLTLYTRYVELMSAYRQGEASQGAAAIRFAWRIRETGMVHSYAMYRELAHRGRGITIPQGAGPDDPEKTNPWKSSNPFTRAELADFVANGIANNQLFEFHPRQFPGPLRPTKLGGARYPFGSFGPRDRYDQSWLVWFNKPGPLQLQARTGIIESYRNRRDTHFQLHTIGQPIDGPVDETSAEPDGKEHKLTLASRVPGLHRLTMSDAGVMTTLTFPRDAIVTREASSSSPLQLNAGSRVYFYVPYGTPTIGGYSDSKFLRFFAEDEAWDDGRYVGPGYFAIPVPEAKQGMCWQVHVRSSGGKLMLMTVPPYVARSPAQLLLPRGVVTTTR